LSTPLADAPNPSVQLDPSSSLESDTTDYLIDIVVFRLRTFETIEPNNRNNVAPEHINTTDLYGRELIWIFENNGTQIERRSALINERNHRRQSVVFISGVI
jgi:hypothetical protein